MTLQSKIEKESGTTDAPQVPVMVWDDAGGNVTLAAAVIAAQAKAPATLFGLNQKTPRFKRQSNGSCRVTIPYSLFTITPTVPAIDAGSSRLRFNFSAQPIFVEWAEEVGKFPVDDAPTFGGLVNVKPAAAGGRLSVVGASIPVPAENLAMDYVVDIATAETYAKPVSKAVGYVNATSFGGYEPGTLMMTSFRGQQRDASNYALSVGWSFVKSFSGTIGTGQWAISDVVKEGHDYGWFYPIDIMEDGPEGPLIRTIPRYAYVNRVWPRGNLNVIGVSPP